MPESRLVRAELSYAIDGLLEKVVLLVLAEPCPPNTLVELSPAVDVLNGKPVIE